MTEKLRVLHCLETVGGGGVEQRRLALAMHLDSSVYDQRLVCTQAIGGLPEKFRKTSCQIHEIGVFRGITDIERYKRALKVVQTYKPHIIHGAVYEGVAIAAICGRLARIPLIIGEETSEPANRSWRGTLGVKMLSSMTHHMVGVSPAVCDYLQHCARVPARKVSCVNNGVFQAREISNDSSVKLRAKLAIGKDDFVIGMVCRLNDENKRVSDVIRSLKILTDECIEARLLVVGAGVDSSALHGLAKELRIQDRVHFVGYQADTAPYYRIMTVFALASVREAFGLVVAEAMRCEIPVVATAVGGVPNILNDGECGLLVPPKRPDLLASAFKSIWADKDLRKELALKAKRRADDEFSAESYVARINELYQRLWAARTS